jgi:tetratricopeptide (TPR) repeat protein
LAGLDALEGNQGESLLPLILEPSRGEDRESYFETLTFNLNRGWAPLTGLYRDRYKYIELPIPELYDLDSDAKELQNLYEESGARQMTSSLAALMEDYSTETSRAIQTAEVDEETIARLQSLGYAVASTASKKPSEYTPEDDPKNLMHLADKLDLGVAAHKAGHYEEAIRIFESILEERPTFSAAYADLAHVLEQTGRVDQAISVLELAIGEGVQNHTLLGRLGAYMQEAGRLEASVALLETVIEEHPTYTEAYNYLGVSYSQMGRVDEALKTFEKLIELDPSYGSAYSNMGSVYLSLTRYAVAEEHFKRALDLDSGLAIAWNGMGVVYAGTGRQGEAVSAWKRTVELDPRQYDTLYNLGTLLTKLNRFDEAIPYLEKFVQLAPRDRYGEDIPKVEHLVQQLKNRA